MLSRSAPLLQSGYIGRFAPSPSGPLHMGSLVCAIASFLDAKSFEGQWLIRIEDIDPPREMTGASDDIIACLKNHGLFSDQTIIYQSARFDAYNTALSQLTSLGLTYFCQCTRKRLKTLGGNYDGNCRDKGHRNGALKLNIAAAKALGAEMTQQFDDGICGQMEQSLEALGDFVIHRKDGLYAYQLAVVIDDIAQHISHVVRGQDLLETTFQQRLLFELLGHCPPHYSHIPLVFADDGRKLSKQNGAPAIGHQNIGDNIRQALGLLGIETVAGSIDAVLNTAIALWPAAKARMRSRHPLTLSPVDFSNSNCDGQ